MNAGPRVAERILILGGGGMVGVQVAREVARKLAPEAIILSALTEAEVEEAITTLRTESEREGWDVRFVPEAGDIFIPQELQGKTRKELLSSRELFDRLFEDIYSSNPDAWKDSALFALIDRHRPDVVVDCINTATAISYQDVFTTSRKVKVMLDRLEDEKTIRPEDLGPLVASLRELIIAQGVPQITRHILYLHRSLTASSVRVYVKVGTTGTGGMGVNIPYTHSEDKPSATLLSKSAIGFAHTGLLFLLARTPGLQGEDGEGRAPMIKEIKPGAMIGFKRLGLTHVKVPGPDDSRRPGILLEPREEPLGESIDPRDRIRPYGPLEGVEIPIRIVGADTGENGFFSIGEFQAITYPRQMEYVTPEEVARTVALEIL
ncbi:MAG TPA: short-chain dehydrogenase, partial [Thermoanaerobaculia bacterium]|nr:short-chain dehydrogenase [Thermoanaerobaculia bacterium]